MQLRWTEEAASDLAHISDYLNTHYPERAETLIRQVYQAPSVLPQFPQRGRAGKKNGTRELVVSPLPYVVVYTVRNEMIYIVRILHGAQQWP
jgi:addiction module RelE/StbE family toxin